VKELEAAIAADCDLSDAADPSAESYTGIHVAVFFRSFCLIRNDGASTLNASFGRSTRSGTEHGIFRQREV
jgi:hypothetical protein